MFAKHPETALIPYLRGELDRDERSRVESHLQTCARCRASMESSASMLREISEKVAQIPEPDWTRYRAQLRIRLAARREQPQTWWRPAYSWMSLAAAGAVAATIVATIAIRPTQQLGPTPPVDQLALEDAPADLGLLRDYPVVEHLDLLENYDEISNLDQFAPAPSRNEKSSS
ncbi:MAG TPA: zf-HC2 domain-containing protein [Candidatus Binataceae bacterium]|nr:zf-HC2 domain-containing protein [Candidatus Binataceae bacterium]